MSPLPCQSRTQARGPHGWRPWPTPRREDVLKGRDVVRGDAGTRRQAFCLGWIGLLTPLRRSAGRQDPVACIDSLADLYPRVAKAYLIGEAADAFADRLKGHVPTVISGDMEAAVTDAYADAAASGQDAVVLLSPACASFDQ